MFGTSKKLWLLLIMAVYFAIAYILLDYYGISCVFLKILGFPCIGCGMTRAFLALLRLDFYAAIRYNIIVFFMPYIFLYIFLDLKKKIYTILLSAVGILVIINWIIKLIIF